MLVLLKNSFSGSTIVVVQYLKRSYYTGNFIVHVVHFNLATNKRNYGTIYDRFNRDDTVPTSNKHVTKWNYSRYNISDDKNDDPVRKCRGVLHKLTPENVERLLSELIGIFNLYPSVVNEFVNQVFEKASTEPYYASMYANFCKCIDKHAWMNESQPFSSFRFLLLDKCQLEFEHRRSLTAKSADVSESTCAVNRQRMAGAMRFIGELSNEGLIRESVIHCCIKSLLGKKSSQEHVEEDLEYFCKLMQAVGPNIDSELGANLVDQYVDRANVLVNRMKTKSRIRFMVEDILELRRNAWVSRKAMSDSTDENSYNPSSKQNFNPKNRPLNNGNFIQKPPDFQPSSRLTMRSPSSNAPSRFNTNISSAPSSNNNKGWLKSNKSVSNPVILKRGNFISPSTSVASSFSETSNNVADLQDLSVSDAPSQNDSAETVKGKSSILVGHAEAFMTCKDKFLIVNNIKGLKLNKEQYSFLVYSLIKESIAYGDSVKDNVCALLDELCNQLITAENFLEGLSTVLKQLNELESEYTRVKSFIAMYCTKLLENNRIRLDQLSELMPNGKYYPLFLLILQELTSSVGRERVINMISSVNLRLGNFLILESLDETQTAESIFENRDLGFLIPYICYESQISSMIKTCKNPQEIISRITSTFSMEFIRSSKFIVFVVSCVLRECSHVNNDQNEASQSKPSVTLDVRKLDDFKELIIELAPDESSQLLVLYAMQTFSMNYGFPKDLLLQLFTHALNSNIASKQVFFDWREDINDEYKGKGEALFQVNQWLNSLEQLTTMIPEEENNMDETVSSEAGSSS